MVILCGTDFSMHAAEAATVAAILTARLHGRLLLVHVYDEAGLKVPSQAAFDHLHQRWEARLAAEAARCRGLGAVVGIRLLPGSPSAVLLDLAAKHRAGLIVVSSLSNVPPVRWLLGSVAERVTEQAEVPTLVVRSEPPFRSWATGERPLRVSVVSDSAPGLHAALPWVKVLNELHRCKITVSRLASASRGCWWQLLGNNQSFGELASRRVADGEWDLPDPGCDSLGGPPIDAPVVRAGGLAGRQLVGLARAAEADLIVVGIHRPQGLARLWHRPLSRDVLREAPMSVACVPFSAWRLPPMPALQRVGQPARDSGSARWRRIEVGGLPEAPEADVPRGGRRQPPNQEMARA